MNTILMQLPFPSTILAAGSQDLVLIALLLMGSIFIAYGVYQAVVEGRASERSKIVDRLMERGGGRVKKQIKEDSILKKRPDQDLRGLTASLAQIDLVTKLQKLIEQANLEWSAPRTILNTVAFALFLFFGSLALKLPAYFGAVLGVAVLFGPYAWLVFRRNRRLNKLVGQLPDVFELLGQALRAGHSLASGIQLISQQLPDPIGTEFGRVFHEQNMGIKIEESLLNMAERVDQLDVRLFVGAVLIQRQTGGDLAEILDKISGVIRSRIELFGLVKALTAEGRMSGYVLLALPVVVALALLFINPDYIKVLVTDPEGKLLLFVAIGMQMMGAAMIKKITNIKV